MSTEETLQEANELQGNMSEEFKNVKHYDESVEGKSNVPFSIPIVANEKTKTSFSSTSVSNEVLPPIHDIPLTNYNDSYSAIENKVEVEKITPNNTSNDEKVLLPAMKGVIMGKGDEKEDLRKNN